MVIKLPWIRRVEERRDKHSHGKEELISLEDWRDRQAKRKRENIS